ncbi:hypothetical protein GCM10023231_29540 [Olivibacter ginsenosidimutans]|uniref:Uncharacterized protein n=1 Tax=Olivibacter ginsenosidimutans TaxID=1176537 RepID=A0ABP9BQL9_9SPHI
MEIGINIYESVKIAFLKQFAFALDIVSSIIVNLPTKVRFADMQKTTIFGTQY